MNLGLLEQVLFELVRFQQLTQKHLLCLGKHWTIPLQVLNNCGSSCFPAGWPNIPLASLSPLNIVLFLPRWLHPLFVARVGRKRNEKFISPFSLKLTCEWLRFNCRWHFQCLNNGRCESSFYCFIALTFVVRWIRFFSFFSINEIRIFMLNTITGVPLRGSCHFPWCKLHSYYS